MAKHLDGSAALLHGGAVAMKLSGTNDLVLDLPADGGGPIDTIVVLDPSRR
jgi:hypothetical protein